MRPWLACATLIVCAGCVPTLVPLGSAVPVTATTPRAVPLEVITRSSARDPLELDGGRARYGDLEVSLGHAVSTAVVAWADAHRGEHFGEPSGARRGGSGEAAPSRTPKTNDGWQLLVELAQAHADQSDGVITVALNVRATLRTRVGHVYLGQTQAHCKEHGASSPERAAPIFYGCMMTVGRELAGWLGGVQP